MSRELLTEIEIGAPAERVWQVLTDFGQYPQWNPFIRKAEGVIREGERLKASLQAPGKDAMTVKPRLITVEPARELAWFGRLVLPWLFDGEHHFKIEPLDDDNVRFVHSERFKGILVPMLWKMLDQQVRQGFEAMNVELKRVAEADPSKD